jgi:preprotein translocase subunit SecE
MEEGEVAQSRRRNRNVEENLEEVIDGSADTDALETDDDLDELDTESADLDEDEVDEDEIEASESRADRKARKAREKAEKKAKSGDEKDVKVDLDETPLGIFGRFGRFVREVVAELRKVIWPNRKDLLVYATVVILFVAVMMSIVGGLDWAFARAVLWVFSGE